MARAAAAAVELVKVYGSGDTAVYALGGVTVEFAAARFTAIMGPSGSGKSTLMHCLAGLDTPTSGSVRIGTAELSGLSDRALTLLRRSHVGFVFQSFNLLPALTAEQNIRLPLELAGLRPEPAWWDRVIGRLDLAGRLGHRPSELSGGQQQRVACARALISRPDVIFADEPTGNLDSASGAEVLGFLRVGPRARPDGDHGDARPGGRQLRRPGGVPRRRAGLGRVVRADAAVRARLPRAGRGVSRAMLRTVLAGLRYRKGRLALSSLAILLGVAFVTGTLVMGASMNQAYFNSFAAGAKNVDAAVTPPSSGSHRPGSPDAPSVTASVLSQVRAAGGVISAAGRLVGQAPLIGSDGKAVRNGELPGVGINVASDPALRGFTVASGHLPDAADQVAVDKSTAGDEHFRLGQTVKVVDHAGRVRAFRLVGTIDLGVDREFGNSTVTAFQTGTGFSVTGRPGYDQIVARAGPGTSQATLTAAIRALPGMSHYQVQTGSQLATAEADAAVHFTQQFTTAILVFALIALVVACIVIYNTFTILITQRGRELALLRCVGASRGQVFGGTLLESAIVGPTTRGRRRSTGSRPRSARSGAARSAAASSPR